MHDFLPYLFICSFAALMLCIFFDINEVLPILAVAFVLGVFSKSILLIGAILTFVIYFVFAILLEAHGKENNERKTPNDGKLLSPMSPKEMGDPWSAQSEKSDKKSDADPFVEILTPQGRYLASRVGLNFDLYEEVKSGGGMYLVLKGDRSKFFESDGKLIRNESIKYAVEEYVKKKNAIINATTVATFPIAPAEPATATVTAMSKTSVGPHYNFESKNGERDKLSSFDLVQPIKKTEIPTPINILNQMMNSKIKLLSVKVNGIQEHIPENDSATMKSLIIEALNFPLESDVRPPDTCLVIVVYFYAIEKKVDVIFGNGIMHIWNGLRWWNFQIQIGNFSYKYFSFKQPNIIEFNFAKRQIVE